MIDIQKLRSELLKKTEEILSAKPDHKIKRVEIEVPFLHLLKWLGAQTDQTKVYFSSRETDDISVAGIGITHIIESSEEKNHEGALVEMRKMLTDHRIKYYGGITFPEKVSGEEWSSFGKLKFFLPKFELIQIKEQTFFACNILFEKKLEDELRQLKNAFEKLIFNQIETQNRIPKPEQIITLPEYGDWEEKVKTIIDAIKKKQFNKIVLARKIIYQFKSLPDPIDIMNNLTGKLLNRYNFLFQFEKGTVFLGSSMERLYKRTGRQILSEGIAGSIERGSDESGDERLINKLLNSKKDNIEQNFVVDFIEGKLSRLCSDLNCSKKEILKLKESSHLKSKFNGSLKEGVSDNDLIDALHPTPAVGGDPWKIVSKLISEYEPFSRGWYAGLVGYIGKDSSDVSVAIRSGLLYNNTLSLFAGVGIVDGSEPEKEWQEGNWKIKNYEEIFE